MDGNPSFLQWPKHPYRGLDFYRESDALLFRERNKDVEGCAAILLGFGVKILILQGSSGSGKSSFLRAGLIPHLKQSERRNFFLSGGDSVIRCTCDPLPEIARALLDQFDRTHHLVDIAHREEDARDGGILTDGVVCEQVHDNLKLALSGPRAELAEILVEALVEICGDLPGKLILVLDQAEEVLTLTPGGRGSYEARRHSFIFWMSICAI